jgi:hypothetical protein
MERGLVSVAAAAAATSAPLPVEILAERPAIVAQAPLQVAANTCNDPFKTMW